MLATVATPAQTATASGDEVVVIYNKKLPASEEVARHYAEVRKVPAVQVIGLDLSTDEEISRAEYENTLEKPLGRQLEARKLWRIGTQRWPINSSNDLREVRVPVASDIRYVVLCYGVPLKISADATLHEPGMDKARPELQRNEAAVDSELAALPLPVEVRNRFGLLRNVNYTTTNAAMLSPTNGILLVTRLDGPTPEIARSLVDKAIEAETNGFWGRAYCDIRSTTDTNYMLGDEWIRGAADICRVLGYDTILDTNGATFPAGQPMSAIVFYAGWYDAGPSGPFLAPKLEFMPGAFAYHLHSGNAWTLKLPDRTWAANLLAKGATCTFGSVNEPYLAGTPDVGTFAARWLITGMTFGEAAYAAQSCLSWQTTVVGDPLYRPFAWNSQLLHMKLERSENPLIEWSHVRVVNLNLLKGTPIFQVIAYLEGLELTKHSPVMMEKLAELYMAVGKPASTVFALEKALQLNPTPQQRLRLRLKLAGQQIRQKHPEDASATYRALLLEMPNYPGKGDIEEQIAKLSAPTNTIPSATNSVVIPPATNHSRPKPDQPNPL
ncbi:MAG: hypothetical protein RLY20_64 [Verrucomicrobiota bacterium]